MSRPVQLRWRQERGAFMAAFRVNGKKTYFTLKHIAGGKPTAKDKAEAQAELDVLLARHRGAVLPAGVSQCGATATLRDLADAYHADKVEAGRCTPRHCEEIKRHLDYLCAFESAKGETLGRLPITALGDGHLGSYLRTMQARRKWSNCYTKASATQAKAITRWATRRGLLQRDPWAIVQSPTVQRASHRIVTPQERQLLIDACNAPLAWGNKSKRGRCKDYTSSTAVRDKAIIALLYESGGRPIELTRARWENLKGNYFLIPEHKTVKKTHRPKVLYVADAAMKYLTDWRGAKTTGWVFPSETGGQMHRTTITQLFVRLKKRLPPDARNRMNDITPYTFRHTRATDLIQSGVDPATAALILGNSPVTMLRNYVWPAPEHVQKAMKVAAF